MEERNMSAKTMTMMAVGDLILGMPDPRSYFTYVAPVLKSGDVVIGQGETPYTTSPFRAHYSGISAPDPDNMSGLTFAGFNVITFATNLIWNYGAPGIEDTIAWLRNHGIAVVGAGMNIDEARRPVIIERKGVRVGILDYNCAGPKESWATSDKPGCAYVHIITHYEEDSSSPWRPAMVYTFATSRSLEVVLDDIRNLRSLCDVLVVCFHKGIIHTPIKLAEYDRHLSYAAIDAGADLILSHHAHILKGVEFYKGKAIFHGLGNFVTVIPLKPDQFDRLASRRRELYNFEIDPEYPTYPFHPESKQTIIAKFIVESGHISRISYLPCLINKQGQPELLKNDERGQEVFKYMDKITRGAGLNARYDWEEDEVVIHVE
jgi:poly-gamma-glutamate capsule biosynthesis protein CapA/YwtB (metallophosphatase superfamily)